MATAGALNVALPGGQSLNQPGGFEDIYNHVVLGNDAVSTTQAFAAVLGRATVKAGLGSVLTDTDFKDAFVASLGSDLAAYGANRTTSFWILGVTYQQANTIPPARLSAALSWCKTSTPLKDLRRSCATSS